MKLHREHNRTLSYMLIPGLEVSTILNQLKPEGRITILRIRDIVSNITGIKQEDIKRRTRKREIVEARQLFFYMAKKHTTLSLAAIGSYVASGGDHANVKHSIGVVEDLVQTNKIFAAKFDRVRIAIKSELNPGFITQPSA